MGEVKTNNEFEQVAILIKEARNRAFHKVNEELVLLYFKIELRNQEVVSEIFLVLQKILLLSFSATSPIGRLR